MDLVIKVKPCNFFDALPASPTPPLSVSQIADDQTALDHSREPASRVNLWYSVLRFAAGGRANGSIP